MVKGINKLTKLKSILKKLNSLNHKQSGPPSTSVVAASDVYEESSSSSLDVNLQPVYVGKSKRRYLISSDVVENPLFRELAKRSGEDEDDVIKVSCEVVLFDHLLWMLENGDPEPESLAELVEFYAC
ncbi:auxin-responsive protein SAUR76-like [Hibiscus syriacus]|uniref:auxin-responsive protein SAUR76-like n=1 Tax=Hibiscus syriacus TaxID=106335 RepID=UPI0019208454|nr:auxin-responsive protein SAUR76-like [Hibiscus syriacus]